MNDITDFKATTSEEASECLTSMGEGAFRATQIRSWIFERGVDDFDQMTNLGKSLRAQLKEKAKVTTLSVAEESKSIDGTLKLLFRLEDGHTIESVYIPDGKRATLCVSTQVGCKLDCQFCLTGKSGFKRNLSAAEIVDQFIQTRKLVPENRISNIVLMGMGEPLDNYDAVIQAILVLTEPAAKLIGLRRITLSTAGVTPGIKKLAADIPNIKLAISLNATTDTVRDKIMPINRKYPIGGLMRTLTAWPLPQGKLITFEYVMLGGVNDSDEDAKRLHLLTAKIPSKINLIPYNPCPGSDFAKPSEERVESFRKILVGYRRIAIVRNSRGADILAACGQLRESRG